jgi:hypothetical protein
MLWGTTGFDADHAPAVFFKLPCLKLFDHDKIINSSGTGQPSRIINLQHWPDYLEGKNGSFASWRDGTRV